MGAVTDKIDAAGNKIAGAVKSGVGKATGNTRLEAKGDAQQVKGAAQKLVGDVKGKVGAKV